MELWVTIAEGILTLAGVCITVYATNRKSKKDLERKVDELVENDREQHLAILRLTVMSESMPIAERIIAGDKYVRKGGNGEVRKFYENMLKEHTK